MKKNILLIWCFFISICAFSQDQIVTDERDNDMEIIKNKDTVLMANFVFDVTDTGNNSKQHEYGSGFFKQKYLIISARKIGGLGGTKDVRTGEPHTQIYCATIKKTGDLDKPLLYSRILNTNDSEGSLTFSPDQYTVYYTRDKADDSIRNFQIYKARDLSKGHGQWKDEQKLPFSSDDYSIENPYLTKDGKTLYFSSNMPGGKGGFDIFKVEVHEDGTFGKPKSLRGGVNTPKDEITPYIDDKGKYLYYSSNGRNTMGGFDVFRVRKVKNRYVRPLNLGASINGEGDDYAFILANDKRGYVTSNRKDGAGNSDVYKFRLQFNKQFLKGIVKDANTKEVLPNTVIELRDMDGNVVATKVGKDGTFSAYVDPYEVYVIKAKKEGYDKNLSAIETNSATQRVFNAEVLMVPTPAKIVEVDGKTMIKVENIYFDFNKSTIRSDSKKTLQKIVTVLNDNPTMKIEINAHTDIRGTDAYNMALSHRRAASTMKYLISQGIAANRMISKGYGETQPLIDCLTKDCTDEEHEINRRIEFVIVN